MATPRSDDATAKTAAAWTHRRRFKAMASRLRFGARRAEQVTDELAGVLEERGGLLVYTGPVDLARLVGAEADREERSAYLA